jgi:glucose-6-phosphate isomerase
MPNPTTLPAWRDLSALSASVKPAATASTLAVSAAGIYADFSRQLLDGKVLAALEGLCEQQGLAHQRTAMFAGEAINRSENRAVLHTALRGGAEVDAVITAQIAAEQDKVRAFSEAVRAGRIRGVADQRFTDVVSIGIGGSALGPQLACAVSAGSAPRAGGPRVHFVSNIDGAHLADVLAGLNAATTLFLITSKTFTTDETMTNARSARAWLAGQLGADAFDQHAVAITTNPAEAARQGFTADRTFVFWDWVGGRYSLWSAVCMPLALTAGYAEVEALLAGAKAMDRHFVDAPFAGNLPILLATVGLWNRNFQAMASHAVLPYAQRLALLPKYLQQLEMESNGKSVDNAGQRVTYATCPVIFGEPGTDGQHSFHQLLHQGSDRISADIVLVARQPSKLTGHHAKLIANGIAQADALWQGSPSDNAHRRHEGGRPVTLLVLPASDSFHLGALIALYEHKVFTQGVLWNINSFDQWGVELGKTLAKSLVETVASDSAAPPPHLAELMNRLRAMARDG